MILNGHGILWKTVEGSLNYDTVLLERFHGKQEKWVDVPYVLLFIFLRDIPDLCPKGADLDVKPSVPSCPLTFLLYLGLAWSSLLRDWFPCAGAVLSLAQTHRGASSAKTRGFHTQLDEGPETP